MCPDPMDIKDKLILANANKTWALHRNPMLNTIEVQSLPSGATPTYTLEGQFDECVYLWKAETAHLSDTTKIVNHHAYLEIIEMGMPIVPLILQRLEKEPDHWHHALEQIIHARIKIPDNHRGDMAWIAKMWLRWAKQHGLNW